MTVPGPTVQGPPKVNTILGGNGAAYASEIATFIACPVALALL